MTKRKINTGKRKEKKTGKNYKKENEKFGIKTKSLKKKQMWNFAKKKKGIDKRLGKKKKKLKKQKKVLKKWRWMERGKKCNWGKKRMEKWKNDRKMS